MQYVIPNYMGQFSCPKEVCTATCASPADMTWAQTVGNVCETGLSLCCPEAVRQMLLHKAPVQYKTSRDSSPAAPLAGLRQEQLDLMMDARKTVDIVLQDRSLPFRSDVVLALTYCEEFEPMIDSNDRYAYDELDWGYTEQPWKQLSSVTPLQGFWAEKKADLVEILTHISELCPQTSPLRRNLDNTIALLAPMTGEEFQSLRQEMDEYMKPREYLFENLLVCLIHRVYLMDGEHCSIINSVHLAMVFFETIRAICARILRESDSVSDGAFASLCWQLARCLEGALPEVMQMLKDQPVYEKTRLQRLLWN